MHVPDPGIQRAEKRVAGTEADGLLFQRDYLVYRSRQNFAPAEISIRRHKVGIGGNRPLEFGDGLQASALDTKDLTSNIVPEGVTGEVASTWSTNSSARITSTAAVSVWRRRTRFTSILASKHCASVECGSSASACSK